MAYNNHEYGSKNTYRQHMDCLNASWFITIVSTAARVSIDNTRSLNTSLLKTIMSAAARVPIVNT